MRDYCPSKKEQEKLKIKKSRKTTSSKKSKKPKFPVWTLISLLLLAVLLISIFSFLKREVNNFYQIKESRSVLLLDQQIPKAYLFFDVDSQEIVLVDLLDLNPAVLDQEKESSLSGSLEKKIFYSLLLDSMVDDVFAYSYSSIDKDKLLSFFKDKKAYYHFLKDDNNNWNYLSADLTEFRELSKKINSEESFFNCPVAIVNTTKQAGLANRLADLLEKSSFLIIKRDSNQENLAESSFIYDPQLEECEPLLDKLKLIMPETKVVEDHSAAQNERAGLVIYIGNDLADLYVLLIDLFHSHF